MQENIRDILDRAPLNRNFYERYTVDVARDLLGKVLVRVLSSEQILAGIIVETEAYRGQDDPASHAYGRKTPRNAIMYGKPGYSYVYFIYGMYHCLNVVTEPEGVPAAVLIRAVEPIFGIELMKKYRNTNKISNLTNGPGKLCQAFNITRELNGIDLTQRGTLYIVDYMRPRRIIASRRIGIKVGLDKFWRFFIEDNPFVSIRKII